MAWLYIAAFGIAGVIVVRSILRNQDQTKQQSYKPYVYTNLKTGERFDIELDYTNPNHIIRTDENSKRPYVLRQSGFMDKGPKQIYLSQYHQTFIYDQWTIVVDGLDSIQGRLLRKLDEAEEEKRELKNRNAVLISKIKILENKLETQVEGQMEKIEDYTKAILPSFLVPKKKR